MTDRTVVLRGSLALALIPAILIAAAVPNWPQAAGPNGNWRIEGVEAPTKWSVARDQNIVWRSTLPNGGQSGIAVWGDRIFLTVFDAYKDGDPKFSGSILGLCLDAKAGKILWKVKLEGPVKSPMMYAYSDSTSPSPITDGKYVWFFNSSGEIGCFDFAGHEVWRHKYTPWGEPYPFSNLRRKIGGLNYRHVLIMSCVFLKCKMANMVFLR